MQPAHLLLVGMIDGLVKQHEGINYFIPAVVFAVFALIVPCVQVGGIFIAGESSRSFTLPLTVGP